MPSPDLDTGTAAVGAGAKIAGSGQGGRGSCHTLASAFQCPQRHPFPPKTAQLSQNLPLTASLPDSPLLQKAHGTESVRYDFIRAVFRCVPSRICRTRIY